MATITDATKVFAVAARTGTNASGASSAFVSGFPVDFTWVTRTTGTAKYASARLTRTRELLLNGPNPEGGASNYTFDSNSGMWSQTSALSDQYGYMWKRAKSFCDVVCWDGTGGNASQTVSHSLGVAPELVVMKARAGDADSAWQILYKNGSQGRRENFTASAAADETITLGTSSFSTTQYANSPNTTFVGYLFASLAGVSKIGIIAHSGSSTDVDCGFSAGARFVLLKRDDADGSWYYWDSVRGIVAGNDPYSIIHTTVADVTNTDFIDPLASGFQISGDFTDGTYLFYAIA
jgi:hypothetical protein